MRIEDRVADLERRVTVLEAVDDDRPMDDLIDCPKCGANDWSNLADEDEVYAKAEAIRCRNCGNVEWA